MNIKKPLLEEKVYSDKNPKGYHTVKVWNSEKEEGKYSFSIARECGSDDSGAVAMIRIHQVSLDSSTHQKMHYERGDR